MSDWHIKGVFDRWGGLDWIIFRHGEYSRPIAVLSEVAMQQLLSEMDRELESVEAARKRFTVK